MVAGIEEEKAMYHIWIDTGTEEKAEQPCAGWSLRCHEAGNGSEGLGTLGFGSGTEPHLSHSSPHNSQCQGSIDLIKEVEWGSNQLLETPRKG